MLDGSVGIGTAAPSSSYKLDVSGTARVQSDLYCSTKIYLGGTADANAIDDYEEGTWTPLVDGSTSVSGQSYTHQQGTYTKIGRLVQVNCDVHLSDKGTISGVLRVSGLPFTPGANPNLIPAATFIQNANISSGHVFYANQYAGNPFLYLYETAFGTDEILTQLYTASIEDDTRIGISLQYRTNA